MSTLLNEDGALVLCQHKVLNVKNWVEVQDSVLVKSTVITAQSPVISLLRNHVEWQVSRTGGRTHETKVQHVPEFLFDDSHTIRR